MVKFGAQENNRSLVWGSQLTLLEETTDPMFSHISFIIFSIIYC